MRLLTADLSSPAFTTSVPWTISVTSLLCFPASNVATLTPLQSATFYIVAVNMQASGIQVLFAPWVYNATSGGVSHTAAWVTSPALSTLQAVDKFSTDNFYASVAYDGTDSIPGPGTYTTAFTLLAFPASTAMSAASALALSPAALLAASVDMQVVTASVVAVEGPASAATSVVNVTDGVTVDPASGSSTVEVNVAVTVLVIAKDAFGFDVSTGGDGFAATLEDATTGTVTVLDNNNGVYTVRVVPRAIATLVIDVTLHGTPLAQSPIQLQVVSPSCDNATMQLDGTLTQCVCRPGYEVALASFANGTAGGVTQCQRCAAGSYAASPSLSTCSHCGEGEFSYPGATACSACPKTGAKCWDGVVTPLDGYWVEDPTQVRCMLAQRRWMRMTHGEGGELSMLLLTRYVPAAHSVG